MKSKHYQYKIECKCENTYYSNATKKEVAFNLIDEDFFSNKCSKCKGVKVLHVPYIEIDKEIMVEWINNEDFYLMEQDEELLLADNKYFDLIIEMLNNFEMKEYKKIVLYESLFIMLYDCVKTKQTNTEFTQKVIRELKLKNNEIMKIKEEIMDYLKEVVFPLIK